MSGNISSEFAPDPLIGYSRIRTGSEEKRRASESLAQYGRDVSRGSASRTHNSITASIAKEIQNIDFIKLLYITIFRENDRSRRQRDYCWHVNLPAEFVQHAGSMWCHLSAYYSNLI
jgi:hypothetical protein